MHTTNEILLQNAWKYQTMFKICKNTSNLENESIIIKQSSSFIVTAFNITLNIIQHLFLWSFPEVTTDDPEYTDVMKKITEIVGSPKNYGLSTEEQEEVDRRKEEERKQKLAEKKRRHEAALAEMAAQYEEWVSWGKKFNLGYAKCVILAMEVRGIKTDFYLKYFLMG